LLICLRACEASADVSGALALVSDYRFRGVSQSGGEPSLQVNLDWSHPGGVFAGVLASTVKLGRTEPVSGVGLQAYAGYSGSLTSRVAWSGGLSAYVFPSVAQGSIDYQEIFLRVGSERWRAGLYLSHDYYGSGAPSAYVTISASHPLGDAVRVFAHAGWLGTGTPDQTYRVGEPTRRLDGRIGVAWDFGFATAEVGVVGATGDNDLCRADPSACKPAAVVAVRKTF
jgi:uncharacterized protein (TIGR02001 family)